MGFTAATFSSGLPPILTSAPLLVLEALQNPLFFFPEAQESQTQNVYKTNHNVL